MSLFSRASCDARCEWNNDCFAKCLYTDTKSHMAREDPHKALSTTTRVSPKSDKRRKFLGASLSIAPVVMTVTSRPVLASTACASASAGSANSTMAMSVCSGLTCSQWKAYAAQWPLPYCATDANTRGQQATLYHCPVTGFSGALFGDRTMLEVLDIDEGGLDTRAAGRYMVAALLNACAGRTPVLDETGVRTMWNDLVNQGYYEPTAGVQWQAPEIIAYIKTTMG
jgi:hypothetical protein